MEKAFNFLVVT